MLQGGLACNIDRGQLASNRRMAKLANPIRFIYDFAHLIVADHILTRSKSLNDKAALAMTLPDRDTIQMLWKVKKLIREEFDANIQINQPDLEAALLQYLRKTKKPALKALLSQLLPKEQTIQTQAIKEKWAPDSKVQEKTKAATREVIYRGQVVK